MLIDYLINISIYSSSIIVLSIIALSSNISSQIALSFFNTFGFFGFFLKAFNFVKSFELPLI